MWAYELSGQNRIFAVSESWDSFADSNDGSLAGSYNVIGRPIWGFVAGLTTKSFLNAAFFSVRSAQTPISLFHRCDSPQERRHFKMLIEPLHTAGLRVSHVQIDAIQHRSATYTPQTRDDMVCCSQCLRWRLSSVWEELNIHSAHVRTPVEFDVCPQCRSDALRAISKILASSPRY